MTTKRVESLRAPYATSGRHTEESVHLAEYPKCNEALIDAELEAMMSLAQRASSMVLALRRKVNIKVRQPLQKIIIPVLDKEMAAHIEKVRTLVMNEVNVKDIELITDTTGIITKRIKPNFKVRREADARVLPVNQVGET